jgi:integral membrane protein
MVKELSTTTLGKFRIVAFLEGCSYLLFALTMPLKYFCSMPKPNYFVGMLHGTLFLLYIILLLAVSFKYKWAFAKMLLAFIVSLIPFGTFFADKRLFTEKSTIN